MTEKVRLIGCNRYSRIDRVGKRLCWKVALVHVILIGCIRGHVKSVC